MAKPADEKKADEKHPAPPAAKDIVAALDAALAALEDTTTKVDKAQATLDVARANHAEAVARVEAAQSALAELLADRLPAGSRVRTTG